MRRALAVAAVIAATVAFGGGVAVADTSGDLDCSDFATPIKISQGYDPFRLDGDHDGIACEGNPGEAVLTDLYADLRGESPSPTPELAHTGAWGPAEHPIRWTAAGAALVVGGAAGVALARRKKEDR